jgi:hypothetical protein
MLNQLAINLSSNRRKGGIAARATRGSCQCAAANHFATAVDISKFDIKLYISSILN